MRKLVGMALVIFGAFFVIWFFIAVAHLAIDARKRGLVEISLTLLFLSVGLITITVGYRRFLK